MDSSVSSLSAASKTPNSSPSLNASPLLRPQTSPIDKITGGSTGKSPLRSCHTNSDAVTHLRRLATATYVNSSPTNRSPTVVNLFCPSYCILIPLLFQFMMMNRKGNTPQSQKKRKLTDPTKAAAAAALVTSSSTSWHLHLPIILMK